MYRFIAFAIGFVVAFLIGQIFFQNTAHGAEPMKLTSYITDQANMLKPSGKEKLQKMIDDLKASDGTQIAVVTVNTLNGESVEDYAMNLAHANGIGEKGKDNGVLFLVAKNEHKMRIEVGYGLEGKLTDVVCSHILNNDVKPLFKEGKFNDGILTAVQNIISTVHGEYTVPESAKSDDIPVGWIIVGIVILFIIFLVIAAAVGDGDGIAGAIVGGIAGALSDGGSSGGSGFSGFGGGGFGGGGCSGGW